MRKAFELQNSNFSIKSDLPKALNVLRGKMLGRRKTLKEENPTVKYRVAEKSYKPVLQRSDGVIEGTDKVKCVDVPFNPE